MSPEKQSRIDRREALKRMVGGVAAASGAALTGCGGGGSGSSGSPPAGLPPGGRSLTDAEINTAVGAAGDFANTLSAGPIENQQDAMLTFLRGRSEILLAGKSEGGVWAVLANGMPYVAIMNRVPKDEDPTRLFVPDGRGTEVPSGTLSAVLLNAMGGAFANEAAVLAPAVSKKQYNVTTGVATIEKLRSFGKPAFFFLSAHGDVVDVPVISNGNFVMDANGKITMEKAFAFSTASPYDPAAMVTYKNEILRGEVCAGSCLENIVGGRGVFANKLLVTTRWVRKYWKFSKNSLVWLSACSSSSNQAMIQACIAGADNQAALYVGWSDYAEGTHALQVAKFVIDRLLGANLLAPKEDPIQRPFDFVKVYDDLRKRGLHSRPTLNPSTGAAFVGRTTEIKFNQSPSSEFGLLVPSLARVLIDEEKDEAILLGTFGTPPDNERAVLIGGLQMTVESWDKEKIRVKLPRTGTGSSGDVVVTVRAHESNKRRITEWEFDLRFRASDKEFPSLRIAGDFKVKFRADIGEYRTKPGEDPIKPVRTALGSNDPYGFIEASGTALDGDCVIKWSGRRQMLSNWLDASKRVHSLGAALKVDTKTRQGALGLVYGSTTGTFFTMNVKCPEKADVNVDFAALAGILGGVEMFADPSEAVPDSIPLPAIPITFGQNFALTAGKYEENKALKLSWEWDAVVPKSPPDPDAERSARVKR